MTTQADFLTRAEKAARILLVSGAVLSLLVFLDVYYYYSWTRQRELGRPVDTLLYYYFPLAVSCFLIAALRFKPAHKINLVIFFTATGCSLAATELFLQSRFASFYESPKPVMNLLESSDNKKKYAAELQEKFGTEIDIRTSREVIADLKKDGIDAVPVVTPSNHLFVKQPDGSITSALMIRGKEVMPLAGVSNRDTLLCNENGKWVDYRSDVHGFNNSNDVWQSGVLQIAALGDSFAHGYCVPSDKNFVALLRNRYPATLNLGVAGDGPLLMLATLKEYVTRFKPKVVLWFYYEGNDLTDLQIERRSALLQNYLKHDFTQDELREQTDIDGVICDYLRDWDAAEQNGQAEPQRVSVVNRFVNFAKLTVLRQKLGLIGGMDAGQKAIRDDLQGSANMDAFREILSQAKNEVAAWQGQFYFVYLPEWARYTSFRSLGKTKRNEVLSLVSDLGISVIDIEPVFRAQKDPLSLFPFRDVGHYNEIGHQLVAEETLKVIAHH